MVTTVTINNLQGGKWKTIHRTVYLLVTSHDSHVRECKEIISVDGSW